VKSGNFNFSSVTALWNSFFFCGQDVESQPNLMS
jgi:hypothetical protein